MKVQTYLDCGCAILEGGGRSWCPTCLDPPVAPAADTRDSAQATGDGAAVAHWKREAQLAREEIDALRDELSRRPTDAAVRELVQAATAITKAAMGVLGDGYLMTGNAQLIGRAPLDKLGEAWIALDAALRPFSGAGQGGE